MRQVLKYDLICTGAMACVAAGVTLNIVYLQALQSAWPSELVLIPVAAGLATPFATLAVRLLAGARTTRFMEAMGAGSLLYLAGSAALAFSLSFLLQSRTGP